MKYLFVFLVACQAKGPTTIDDVKREAGQAVETTAKFAKENVAATRDDAVKSAEVQLAALDKRVHELKADVAKRNDAAKAQAQKSLDELDAKRAELAANLAALKADTEQGWRDTQRKVDAVGQALDASLKDLKARLDKI